MSPELVFSIVGGYFLLLILISRITTKKSDNETFFTANRQSPWYLVAFGMIGATLSGVTFISVPGIVGEGHFLYYQMVMGYIPGYIVIALVLLPLYYKLNLTSIYTYLEQRFGFWSYKTGAFFFLLSRTIGASFRLYLVSMVLQLFLFDAWDIPFEVTVIITIALIWVYTFRGGIKTIVWTDTLQTLFMLLSLALTIYIIAGALKVPIADLPQLISEGGHATVFNWDWKSKGYFWKQFFSGAFMAIVMTGLDQDMMQKNLTCRNLKDAQRNMYWFSASLLVVNLMFLALGALLYIYADKNGVPIPENADQLFPTLALHHLGTVTGVLFLLGITAAAYSSADSALTSLTTSFCVDFLKFDSKDNNSKKTRVYVHIGFSVLLAFVILIFRWLNDDSVINSLFNIASYTYGPLLGLFAFGLFTKYKLKDNWVLLIGLITPILSYIIDDNSKEWFGGYKFGYELLLLNGILTFVGLFFIRKKDKAI